jgi:hypothetical protein
MLLSISNRFLHVILFSSNFFRLHLGMQRLPLCIAGTIYVVVIASPFHTHSHEDNAFRFIHS